MTLLVRIAPVNTSGYNKWILDKIGNGSALECLDHDVGIHDLFRDLKYFILVCAEYFIDRLGKHFV